MTKTPNDAPSVTQEMIDLYDDYTHVSMDRRKFINTLTRIAGGTAAAAAALHALEGGGAQAAMIPETDPRVKAETISYPGASGELRGHLALPAEADGPRPGVVVIHQNRGLNAHIEDIARRLAVAGFVALAPDLLSPVGGTPEDSDQARDLNMALDPQVTIADLVATATFLRGHEATTGKVGAVGFCWGGLYTNLLAVNDPELKAGVAYYGEQPPAEDAPKIKAAMLLHYAGLDQRVNAGIDAYKAALDAAGVNYRLFIYDDVNHAFNDDTREARYDEAAAKEAWDRTIAFLTQALA